MAKTEFKYNINHQYSLLPREITLNDLVKHLEKAGIPERTFYRDRAIELKGAEDIPTERIVIYSQVFDCPISSLINYKVKVKPIVAIDQRVKSPLS